MTMRLEIPREMSPEERVDALVELLAEGILLLAETGKLNEGEEQPAEAVPVDGSLSVGPKEGKVSNGA